jgi:peptidoglycan hydrolase-like protein with peptidoglycan-binding domain
MANPGQATISQGATGDGVRRLQRALRRTAAFENLAVDGEFGPLTEKAVKEFQGGNGLVVDGVVGPLTWAALPDGGPMPTLAEGSTGDVVLHLQSVLNHSALGGVDADQPDGIFGPHTKAAVEALQRYGRVTVDGIVGDETWAIAMGAASATLESLVGLNYVTG